MGAATVLMASEFDLPASVRGIIADCGYTSPRDILKKVIRQCHLPVAPIYFLVRLGARAFGRFDPEAASAARALEKCRVPVLFIHGEADNFVPCDMSRENYVHCAAPKALITVPGADHGFSYLVDREGRGGGAEAVFQGDGRCVARWESNSRRRTCFPCE